MKKIGFIGIGVMGAPIISHLLQAGYSVLGYTRTKEKADAVISQGMQWCDSVAKVVSESDLIFTMLGFPQDVEETYYGESGIFAHITHGKYIVDLTTSTPSLAIKLFETAQAMGVFCLDSPVTGGDIGAKNGTLTIMVGGEETVFKIVEPILSTFGSSVTYMGPAGNGQHTKMANQTAIAAALLGMAESLTYAQRVGLDESRVLNVLAGGSATSWQLQNNGPKALNQQYDPGFYIKHFSKDMLIALAEMEGRQVTLPGLQLISDLYLELIAAGKEDLGTQALLALYQER